MLVSTSRYLRQLHPHEHPQHEEGEENAAKAQQQQQHPVQLWCERVVRLVEYDEAHPSESKQETRGEPFHDVLSIDTVRHECNL